MKRRVLLAAALIALTGCSGDGVDRTVPLASHDYAYEGLESFTGRAGEKVEFEMMNVGPSRHEFVVIDPVGTVIGGIAPTGATETGRKKLSLKKPGTYTFACFVDDHLSRDMRGTFQVK